ncbi:MAG: response regulator [Elusimicrobia bacterium]|nr:response regulator [Elusimicrobiota bacterium]
MPAQRTISIQQRLLLGILPCGAGAILIVLGLNYYQLKHFTISTLENGASALVNRLAEDIEHELEQRPSDLLTLAQNPLFLDYHNNVDYGLLQEAAVYRAGLEKFLGAFASRVGVYPLIIYSDARGREICRIVGGQSQPAGKKPMDTPYLAKALETPEGHYASINQSGPNGETLIYYAAPIRNPIGEPLGVLALGYGLDNIEKKLRLTGFGAQGSAYLEHAQGEIIAGSKVEVGNGVYRSAALKSQPWRIHLVMEPDYFLAPLRRIRDLSLAVGLAAAFLSIGLIILVVRSMTRPIRRLVEATGELARGNLDFRVQVEEPAEMGILSGAFNDMAAKLKEREFEQKKLQNHLIRSEKLSTVGRLIAGIAHELNNPLNGVTGYAELIQSDGCPPELHRDLKQIQNHAQRCRRIVENLLLFVRHGSPEKKPVDIDRVIRSVLTLLEYRMSKADSIRIDYRPAAVPAVWGNFQQLEQVFLNLIQNACDALSVKERHDRRVAIGLSQDDGYVCVEIKDNGPGIPAEFKDKIFDPFFTTKEAGRGTGLGLAITSQIVADHAGTISAESVPAEGAVFAVRLPAPPAGGERLETMGLGRETRAVEGKKILVVDDERNLAQMTARLLKKMGHVGEAVYGGAPALKKIKRKKYDFLLVDLEMPGMNGRDFYRALKADHPAFCERLIFMTGDVLSAGSFEFFETNKLPYITKPFGSRELAEMIERRLKLGLRDP